MPHIDPTGELPAALGGSPIRESPPPWPPDDPEILEALRRAAVDGTWGRYHGPHCPALAERLAADHGCRHAILCSSGTAAVELALRGLKVGPSDEVILAAYDFSGNFANVLTVGAVPVLVDVAPGNWNLDPSLLEGATTPATKAVIVSHLHGGSVPMPRVLEFARSRGLRVIEDACQMPGSAIHGRVVGTWGDVGVLSFGGSKLLTAGRGGAVLTPDPDIAQRICLHTRRGNEAYPLSELQAAVLLPQLNRLAERNRRRTANAAELCRRIVERPGLRPLENLPSESIPGYYKLGLKYDPAAFAGLPRDLFAEAMRAEGIALDPGFRALHRTHSRRRFRQAGPLTNADAADARMLVLHHPVLLEDSEDLDQVITAVERIHRHAGAIAMEPSLPAESRERGQPAS